MNPTRFHIFILLVAGLLLFSGCTSDESKFQNFMTDANGFYESGDYDKAVIQLKNALKIQNRSKDANDLLSKIYLKQGNAQEAFKTFIRLEQIDPDNLEYQIQLASFHLLAKNRTEAETRVEKVLSKEPDNIKALYLKAGVLSLHKRGVEEIEPVYLKIIRLDPEQDRAHFSLAQLYASQKKFEDALTHLNEAIRIQPDNIAYSTAVYRFYLTRGEYETAQKVLETLGENRPTDARPRILLGNFYQARNQPEMAETLFLKAIEVDPEKIEPLMVLARFYNGQEKRDAAEALIKKALEIEPGSYEVKNAYADFHFVNDEILKADTLVDEILAARPEYIPGKLLKGRILIRQRAYDPAIKIFQDLVNEEPDSDIYNLLLGSAYYEKNDLKNAKPFIAKAVEKNPNQFQGRFTLADIHFKQGDLHLAEAQLETIIKRFPNHYNANALLGNIKIADRQFTVARAIYEDLVRQDPNNPVAYYRLGLIDRSENRLEPALENFNKALEINPNLMDVFSNIISIHAGRGNHKKALELCDAHLAKVGETPILSAVILNLKGNLFLSTNDTKQGKSYLQEAIDKNPEYLTPYMSLANLLTQEERTDEAIELYKVLIEKRPDQATPHGLIANLYERKGDIGLAEHHYVKALEINPTYVVAANNLAFLYAEQGKELNKALDLARMAKQTAGNVPAIMDTLGWVYYKKELYDNARIQFEACVEQEPDNPIFHYHLGLALNKKGEYARAEKALEKALKLQTDFDGADDARKVLRQL